jgi:predicted RNA-binding protein YlxR (DUF448 family)
MNKDEVVRIVAGSEGILIDYREKLPGRAAYICPRQGCIVNAFAKDTLARALRLRVRPPTLNAFITQLTEVIKDKIRSLLFVSIKAGKIAAGYSAVHDALGKERVHLLLYATDLSEGTRDKVAVHSFTSTRQESLFTREELGVILNRGLVGVVAILEEGLADSLWNEIQRFKELDKLRKLE